MKLSDYMNEINSNLSKLITDKEILLEKYDKYTKLYESESKREKINYDNLFENIKNLDIYKLCCDENKEYIQNSKLNSIKNQIIIIEELKICKDYYELETYRTKDSIEKITIQYNNMYNIKSKIIVEQFDDDYD